MVLKGIQKTQALSTQIRVEKIERIANECGVKAILIDTHWNEGQWVNDFEIEGESGKVDIFLERVKDVEV